MIPKKLGSYEIIEEIGQGGMATVYRAYQARVKRYVAIKVMRRSITNDILAVGRFQREARLVARLEHPYLLPLYDFDSSHNPPYLVMRYVDGGSLKEMLGQKQLSLSQISAILEQISAALDYAHRQGVVHRDMKPANIMLDQDENAFVADFGIARLIKNVGEVKRDIVKVGAVIGTPQYMSPEQVKGVTEVDHRADIYALGVILFEALTGQLPYQAENPWGVMVAHVSSPIPQATAINPNLPQSIDDIIITAMAKEPSKRYESASELAKAIRQALQVFKNGQTLAHIKEIKQGDSYKPLTKQSKHATILYANLSEYNTYLELIDVEDVAPILETLEQQLEAVIVAHGGQVSERNTATILALWGVETIHENDPEQAIRAALTMRKTLRTFLSEMEHITEEESLPMQIALTTGAVLFTPLEKEAGYKSSGAPISLAKRLERTAEPGNIIISHHTYSHVHGIFDIEQNTPLRVRGRKRPLPTYNVLAAKSQALHFNIQGVEGIETSMVGRETELAYLQDVYHQVIKEKKIQIVTIVGKAGVGKSRLLYAFTHWLELQTDIFWTFRGQGKEDMHQQPFALIRNIFAYRFEIQENDTLKVLQEKLEQGIATFMAEAGAKYQPEMAHYIGHLLGFDFSHSTYLETILSNSKLFREQAEQYLFQFFRQISQRHPIVMDLENIHWADESSLDILNKLLSQNTQFPLLILCVTRPELYERRPDWDSEQANYARLELNPLSTQESHQLVTEILQKVDEIPDSLRDLIVKRAEGNPFYMEELIKTLLEDHIIVKEGDVWRVELERLRQVRIPSTLVGLLQAHLDSLFPVERIILLRAAAIGRVFWDKAVLALAEPNEMTLDVTNSLESLLQSQLVARREVSAFAGSQEYVFKSAILHDVVYAGLPAQQRRLYHLQVANWLIKHSGERLNEISSLIAEHFERGGDLKQAAFYLRQAGEQALQTSAFREALAFFERALTMLKDDVKASISLKINIATCLIYLGAFDKAREHLLKSLVLAREQKDREGTIDAFYYLGTIAWMQGLWAEAEEKLSSSLKWARKFNRQTAITQALTQLGWVATQQGSFVKAKNYLEESLSICRMTNNKTEQGRCLSNLGVVMQRLGRYDAAKTYLQEGLFVFQVIGNRSGKGIILGNLGEVLRRQNNFAQAKDYYQEALTIFQEIGNQLGEATALVHLGLVSIGNKEIEAARDFYRQGLQLAQDIGALSLTLDALVGIGKILSETHQTASALDLLGLALYHPATNEETLETLHDTLTPLKATLPPAEVTAGLERGQHLNLGEVVAGILAGELYGGE